MAGRFEHDRFMEFLWQNTGTECSGALPAGAVEVVGEAMRGRMGTSGFYINTVTLLLGISTWW